MDVYTGEDYRSVLRVACERHGPRSGILTRLATAIGCQKSHLSQVLAGNVHLTLDQAFRLALHWKLDDEERAFFLLLVQRDRASTREYRQHLSEQIESMRVRHESLAHRYARDAAVTARRESSDRLSTYYRHWRTEVVHLLASIPEFDSSERIATRLRLPVAEIQASVSDLIDLGLLAQNARNRLVCLEGGTHVPADSVLAVLHQITWRMRALDGLRERANAGVHYSGLYALSRADAARIKTMARTFLDATRDVAVPSLPEDLICVNLDIFEI